MNAGFGVSSFFLKAVQTPNSKPSEACLEGLGSGFAGFAGFAQLAQELRSGEEDDSASPITFPMYLGRVLGDFVPLPASGHFGRILFGIFLRLLGAQARYTVPVDALLEMAEVKAHEALLHEGVLTVFDPTRGKAIFVSHQWLGRYFGGSFVISLILAKKVSFRSISAGSQTLKNQTFPEPPKP